MNVNFKLAWFEDEESAYVAHYDDVESIIRSYDLIPIIQRYRSSEFDINNIKESDLILADYDLGTDNCVDLIHDSIRKKQVVIDALLYSSKYDKMVQHIQKVDPLLEGVYCAKRGSEDLTEKLKNLVFRIVKRAQSIENLRGFVMEYTSIFDKKIVQIIQKFANLGYTELILKYINEEISKSRKSKTYKSCTKEGTNCESKCDKYSQSCIKINGCCYKMEVADLVSLNHYDLSEKSRILNHLLCVITKERNIEDERFKDFHKTFYKEIIVYRNSLAHEKSNENTLYLRDGDTYISINDELFSQIKKSIKKYLDIFEAIENI